MPSTTDIIQLLNAPPISALQQVLDLNGPFAAGDHTITAFLTNGAFLLPAGTYPVVGTYGVVVRASTIPIRAGHLIGFNGIVGGQDQACDTYYDVFAQVVQFRTFPITGAIYPITFFNITHATTFLSWAAFSGSSPDYVGLHVAPGWAVELYWMCVL
jgi:hypothetical protein